MNYQHNEEEINHYDGHLLVNFREPLNISIPTMLLTLQYSDDTDLYLMLV